MIDPTCSAEGDLQELVEKEGWVAKGDQYFLHNQEEHVIPKKIISLIEFDSELMENMCIHTDAHAHTHTLSYECTNIQYILF